MLRGRRRAQLQLVVHDIGGPVGFEIAAALPDRVASLTIFNTLIIADEFKKPWSMRPFGISGLGRLWLASVIKPVFRQLMCMQGAGDRCKVSPAELDAYRILLKRVDGGQAFLKIMQRFETTPEKRELYVSVVRDVPYPVQIVWGRDDPALRLSTYGEQAREAAGLGDVHTVPGKHVFQEEQPEAIAEHVDNLARQG